MARKKTKKRDEGVTDKVAAQDDAADEMMRKLAAGEDPYGEGDGPGSGDNPNGDDDDDAAAIAAAEAEAKKKAEEEAKKQAAAAAATKKEPRFDPGSFDPGTGDAGGDGNVSKLEARLAALEGKYNAETARLNTALQASQNIIEQQEALIKRMQAGGDAGGGDADSDIPKLNPDEFSSYGSEMEGLVALVNKQSLEIKRLVGLINSQGTGTQGGAEDRIKKVEDTMRNLGQTVHMSAKQTYYQALDNGIRDANNQPEWERINRDPKFAQWLASEEPMTGIQRKAILLKANQDLNADRVISIFNEFKRSQGAAMPSNAGGTNALESQVVPDSAAGGDGDDSASSDKKGLVNTEMLNKAKNDFVKGQITEAEFDKVAADYQRSIAKGWIKPGQ
jgi:hypothetical protein